jgi:hypothetical protein
LSHQATTWVMEFSQSKLADRLVLGAIAHRVSNDDGEAWPSVRTIAREANVSERSAHYSIKKLQGLGELEVRIASSKHGTNTYKMPKFLTWVQTLHLGVQKTTGRVQNPRRGVQSTTRRGAEVAPEPSFELSGTKIESQEPIMISEEAQSQRQKRLDQEQLQRLERILRENPNLIPAEQARIQLAIDDLKRKAA